MDLLMGIWLPSTTQILLGAGLLLLMVILVFTPVFAKWGAYWVQAYMSGADVSLANLIVMSLLKIEHVLIVTAKIMVRQAGLNIARDGGMTTEDLMAHRLAGGNVTNVVRAIIAAERAGMNLDFSRAAAIDLAGRDVLQAVQTSISPRVISIPDQVGIGKLSLSAVAKNGVELLVVAKVTVRTNLDQLIGGATEETIAARVGQGIVSAIGSAESHNEVLELPSQISERAMAHGLDANSAFSIISIDIANIEIGENTGARLQTDQADADTRIARANAEVRRAFAVADKQEMRAKVREAQADLVLAEALVPVAIANAFRAGQIFRAKPEPTKRFRVLLTAS